RDMRHKRAEAMGRSMNDLLNSSAHSGRAICQDYGNSKSPGSPPGLLLSNFRTAKPLPLLLETLQVSSRPPWSAQMRQHREQQQRHDIGDLDHRGEGGACRILVGVADGVAGERGLVRLAALEMLDAGRI